ncbi:transposase [Pseudoalteromonas sp. SWXJZ94C]|uniref:REP-associated tyrosine transposase n=1 Tax=Pseudoalteromonas sp. SWXJZ94C TaxID=2792065 RepID=UPI0018CF3082|nr:transposase [Pseudoalteromonas sp. SWXJZ94C]MBH0057871.1 transposase [Pseudoalteromonas sp. SWXJZ94C]
MKHSDLLRKGRVSLKNHFYSITLVAHKRENKFVSLAVNRLITKEMRAIEVQKTAQTIAFVIMPNHIHWLIQLGEKQTLCEVVKSFKGRCSKSIRDNTNIKQLWQRNYYDHLIRDEEDLINNARYIIANPLRANIVKSVALYPYWDCIYLNERK